MPKYPSNEVPESSFFVYPDGPLTVRVTSQEDGETRNGKFAIRAETRVLAPKQYAGQPFNFQFVIGTEGDPQAEQPETWTQPPSCYAAGRYKSYLKAAGVPNVGDTEEEAEHINTAKPKMVIQVGHHESDGKTYNDTLAFYSLENAPAETAAAPAKAAAVRGNSNGVGVKAAARRPATAPARATDTSVGEEAWDD